MPRPEWLPAGLREALTLPLMPAHPLSPALQSRYRIDRELGRGGMGTVYLATDLRLDRPVALKVLPPEFATDTSLRERFLRETRTAASFSHPNIVPVHAVADDGTSLAFVMGFVEGESLGARVARTGPLDARSAVRLLQTSPTPSPTRTAAASCTATSARARALGTGRRLPGPLAIHMITTRRSFPAGHSLISPAPRALAPPARRARPH